MKECECSFLILSLIGVEIVYYESVLISLNPGYRPRIQMENIKELANVLPCLIFCLTLCFDWTEQEPGIALTIILTRMWPQLPVWIQHIFCGIVVSYINLKNIETCLILHIAYLEDIDTQWVYVWHRDITTSDGDTFCLVLYWAYSNVGHVTASFVPRISWGKNCTQICGGKFSNLSQRVNLAK